MRLTLGSWLEIDGEPNLVLIGVPNEKGLRKAKAKLEAAGIEYVAWEEPDYDYGFTALATAPLDRSKKEVLANYRLWQSPMIPGSSEKERLAASPAAGRSVVQVHPGEPTFEARL